MVSSEQYKKMFRDKSNYTEDKVRGRKRRREASSVWWYVTCNSKCGEQYPKTTLPINRREGF